MRVRAITISCCLSRTNFLDEDGGYSFLDKLLETASMVLKQIARAFEDESFEVQTTRVAFNSYEEWLLSEPTDSNAQETVFNVEQFETSVQKKLDMLQELLNKHKISFCSLGACKSSENLKYIPTILNQVYKGFACSYGATAQSTFDDFTRAAEACVQLSKRCGDNGNFGYCVASNCPPGIPFFPASSSPSLTSSTPSSERTTYFISVGLEAGELLFMGLKGVSTYSEATENLKDILYQVMYPLHTIVKDAVSSIVSDDFNLNYLGLDTSIAPGSILPESVGFGIEQYGPSPVLAGQIDPEEFFKFGDLGTVPIIAAITTAIKGINDMATCEEEKVLTTGYNGLMIPVMEDIILAQRAQEKKFTIRDLMLFSTTCGVGIDTVPVAEDVSVQKLAGLYLEMNAIAYRLGKPLSCRLLPMNGLKAGDLTKSDSPYLIDTTVFDL